MTAWLRGQGHAVDGKRAQRLMRRMGIEAIYRRPRATRPDSGHKVYPDLLRTCSETFSSTRWTRSGRQTSPISPWRGDSCAWRSSWTSTAGACSRGGCPTPWKPTFAWMRWGWHWPWTCTGYSTPTFCSQFTSEAFTSVLLNRGVQISMDSAGAYVDNVFVARLW